MKCNTATPSADEAARLLPYCIRALNSWTRREAASCASVKHVHRLRLISLNRSTSSPSSLCDQFVICLFQSASITYGSQQGLREKFGAALEENAGSSIVRAFFDFALV